MPREFSEADTVAAVAGSLIPTYHPDLATARIKYVFVDKASTKGGVPQFGKATKASGFLEWILEADFVIQVALDIWNSFQDYQRTAAVDHLLEQCTGEEDEKTGAFKWRLREPDAKEFTSILDRHGAWHLSLANFANVAKMVDLSGFIQAETTADLNEQEVTE